jgi:ABC-type Fe3+-hydroxamate transport system substrate-binding protein
LTDAGGLNVADSASTPYPVFSVERALALHPDVVVDGADTKEGREVLRQLPGLKEARWVSLPSQRLLHPGPGLAEGLEELFRLLHP